MAAIARELGLAQTLSISRIVAKLQEIHKSEENLIVAEKPAIAKEPTAEKS